MKIIIIISINYKINVGLELVINNNYVIIYYIYKFYLIWFFIIY